MDNLARRREALIAEIQKTSDALGDRLRELCKLEAEIEGGPPREDLADRLKEILLANLAGG